MMKWKRDVKVACSDKPAENYHQALQLYIAFSFFYLTEFDSTFAVWLVLATIIQQQAAVFSKQALYATRPAPKGRQSEQLAGEECI